MPRSRYVAGTVSWYGLLITIGIAAALWLSVREEKRLGLPRDTALDLALLLLPMGVLGARIYYAVFSWDHFRQDPLSVLRIWEGGLAIYGGILGGLAAVLIVSRKKRLPLPCLLDMAIIGVPLAQAIGRWGNFFNREAYGLHVTDPAWQFFPAAVLIGEGSETAWHMATFFYESAWDLAVFAFLWLGRRRIRRPGDTFLRYGLLYGAGRLVIEGFRMDSLFLLPGLRVSQALAMLAVLAVTLCFLLRSRKTHRTASLALSAAALLLTGTAALFISRASCRLLYSFLMLAFARAGRRLQGD